MERRARCAAVISTEVILGGLGCRRHIAVVPQCRTAVLSRVHCTELDLSGGWISQQEWGRRGTGARCTNRGKRRR